MNDTGQRILRISFRYGYTAVQRYGLLLWTVAWGIGLICVLWTGVVNWDTPDGAVEYSRASSPTGYWVIVAVLTLVCVLGFAMTFEVSFKADHNADIENDSE